MVPDPCTRAPWTELDVTAGASSQGTNPEPGAPGLLLGVKLHTQAQDSHMEGDGLKGIIRPHLLPQEQRRQVAPKPTPLHPSRSHGLLLLLPALSKSTL